MNKKLFFLIIIMQIFSCQLSLAQNVNWNNQGLNKYLTQYYPEDAKGYIYVRGDSSIIVSREINAKNYVQDTLRAYFDYLWHPVEYKSLATYFTYVVRAGDFWECRDYFHQIHKEFRWGFFEDQQLSIPVGPFRQYYPNGKIQKKGYFKNRKKSGVWEWFNQEGQLTGKFIYKDGAAVGYCFQVLDGDSLVLNLDSLGAGYSSKKLANGKTLLLGKYVSGGIKDSIWNHYDSQNRLWYTQQYNRGKLNAEVCFDTNGTVVPNNGFVPAKFKGKHSESESNAAIRRYLVNHVHFPGHSRLNIPKGKIIVQLVVEKDGSVGEIQILKPLEPHLELEIVNALKKMPKWTPAEAHGRLVESYYVLPFTFSNE